MSTDLKPRPFFQFHLSTLLVLMFVSGGLIWLNTMRTVVPFELPFGYLGERASGAVVVVTRGWPFIADARFERTKFAPESLAINEDGLGFPPSNNHYIIMGSTPAIHWIVNASIAIAVLVIVAFTHRRYLHWRHRAVEIIPD